MKKVVDLLKLMVLLTKKDGLTEDEFAQYWLHTHARLAKKIPRVRRYIINVVKKHPKRESNYHGIAEMWFDNLESMKMAFASSEGRATQEDTHNFASNVETLYTEEYELTI